MQNAYLNSLKCFFYIYVTSMNLDLQIFSETASANFKLKVLSQL